MKDERLAEETRTFVVLFQQGAVGEDVDMLLMRFTKEETIIYEPTLQL